MSTTKQIIQLYWRHAWRYRRMVVGITILMPATIFVHQFLTPILIADVFDRLSTGDFNQNDLWGSFGSQIIIYTVFSLLGGVVLWRIVNFLVWRLETYVQRDLAQTQFNHLMRLDAKFHANSFGGSLVSQTNKLNGAYVRLADTTIYNIYTLLIAFAITVTVLWSRAPIYVVALTVMSAVYIAVSIKITKPVRKLVEQEAEAQNKQTGVLADMITNIMAVKSFAAMPSEQKRFAEAAENTRRKTINHAVAALSREVVFGTATSLIDVLAFTLAVASVVLFDAQLGTVFLVMRYTSNITSRLWEFPQHALRNYNRGFGDAKHGAETLNLDIAVKDLDSPEKSRISDGEIVFDDVSFKHEDSQDTDMLFEHLKLVIKPGEKIGLVGHSGSGKTTLTKLLLRFSDINEGAILIDGQNIARIGQDDLRNSIAYVPQEPLLFHRSIAENISYGSSFSQKEIIQAAKRANAHEFIKTLPDGYETLVGERGVKLSGGQRQRVAIARALIKDSPILVLDEATSALDSESEQLIQSALWKLMEGRTAIVIAHRLSTIQKMDRIVVMEEGKIIEQGSHDELIKHKGKYAELWAHQSGGFLED